MNRGKIKLFDIFTLLCIFSVSFAYHDLILSLLDGLFFSVTGKDLSARSAEVHTAAVLLFSFIFFFIIYLITRLILQRFDNKKIWYSLFTGMLCIPIIQTLIICANQILRRDDYWEIADAHSYGFPGSLIFEVTHHNGRYLSWGLKSMYAFLPPIPFSNILLVLNIVLLTTGFTITARSILDHNTDHSNSHAGNKIKFPALLAGIGLAANAVLLASNPWEVWFWGSGTMVYGLSISLCVFTTAMTIKSGMMEKPPLSGKIITAVCCFLACGGSELSTASLLAFLFILLMWRRLTTGKWHKLTALYFLEAVICCAGVLLLSGSINAAGEFAEAGKNAAGNLFLMLPEFLKTSCTSVWRYTFINGKILLTFFLFFLMFGSLFKIKKDAFKKHLLISLMLLIVANLVPILNIIIDFLPARVMTISLCWVFAAMALTAFSVGSLLFHNFLKNSSEWKSIVLLCIIVILVNSSFFYRENIDLVRKIRQSWVVRDESLKNAFDSNETIVTCSIPTLGSSHDDIEADPKELYNIAMRMYYRVPAVIAEGRCRPFE